MQLMSLIKQQYSISTGKLASTVSLPTDALLCKNPKCTMHYNDIDCYYSDIISVLKYLIVTVYLFLWPLLNLIILLPAGMNM